MYLYTVFLPLDDNEGQSHPYELMRQVQHELTKKFGGITAYTRSPAEGVWKSEGKAHKDEIVIIEVMSEKKFTSWWVGYRKSLEKRFKQKEVLIRRETLHIVPSK